MTTPGNSLNATLKSAEMVAIDSLLRLTRAEQAFARGDYPTVLSALESLPRERLVQEVQLGSILARTWLHTGRAQEGLALLEQMGGHWDWQGNTPLRRSRTVAIGVARFHLGEVEAARAAWEQACEAAAEAGDRTMLAVCYNNLGAAADLQCQWPEALAHYERAAIAYQQLGDPLGLGWTHSNRALSLLQLGRLGEAQTHIERAIGCFRASGNDSFYWMAHLLRARIQHRGGSAAVAEALARQVLEQFERLGMRQQQASAHRLLGAIARERGSVAEASSQLEAALEQSRSAGTRMLEAEVLEELALLQHGLGDAALSMQSVLGAQQIYCALGAPRRARLAMERLLQPQAGVNRRNWG